MTQRDAPHGRGLLDTSTVILLSRIMDAALLLPIYTCKPDDFEGIEGLEVVAIPIPA